MGTLATLKTTPDSLTLHVHVKTGKVWESEEYSQEYGEHVPQMQYRILDSNARVFVDLDEKGEIFGFTIQLSDSAEGFKQLVVGKGVS